MENFKHYANPHIDNQQTVTPGHSALVSPLS